MFSSCAGFSLKMQAKTLVSSHNTLSRLDFYIELSAYGYTRFCLGIQNFAARLVILELYDPNSHHHSTLLEEPHWLPITKGIGKSCLHTCDVLCYRMNGSGPAYLTELLLVYSPSASLSWHTHLVPQIQQY